MFRLRTRSLDPVNAEITVEGPLQDGDELRGKLMGPRCRYATTIEIAYPLRKTQGGYQIIIPEPSAWEPASPFLYTGKIEHHRQGQKLGEFAVEHGLVRLAQSGDGWRLNGRPFEPRPAAVDQATTDDLLRLREQGINCLIPVAVDAELWMQAARIGFFLQPPQTLNLPWELAHHFVTLRAQ